MIGVSRRLRLPGGSSLTDAYQDRVVAAVLDAVAAFRR